MEVLEHGRAVIAQQLMPCGADRVGPIMTPALIVLKKPSTAGMTPAQVLAFHSAQRDQYEKLLAHVPADILDKACDTHCTLSDYAPTPHELLKHAEPEIAKLQRYQRRIEALIKAGGLLARSVAPTFTPEPEDVRDRAAVARYLKFKDGFNGHILKPRAIEAERRLATSEGREVAEWAREALAPAKPAAQPIVGTLPRDDRAWDKASDAAAKPGVTIKRTPEQQHAVDQTRKAKEAMAAAGKPWRAGSSVYHSDPGEEPPPREDIAEGDQP